MPVGIGPGCFCAFLALVLAHISHVSRENGRSQCTCYHPLFCLSQFGDAGQAFLRNGKVHSADGWQSVLEPIIARYRSYEIPRSLRGDAGFADPEVHRLV